MTGINLIEYVDLETVLFLLAFGFILKHAITKFPNQHIPLALMIISLVYYLVRNGVSTESILNSCTSAVITAAVAIGLHSSGKGFLENIGGNKEKVEEPIDVEEDLDIGEEDE